MRTKAKKKLLLVTAAFFTGFLVVTIKLSYVMIAQADKYLSLARNLHQRDREIKAPRGSIYDRNGVKIASNKAVYHIIGRLTSPDTSEYEKIKKDLKKHVVYISLQEIEEMSLNKLYSYDTFLKMDILKKIIKPKNFSLILLEEVSDNFWNWEL